MDNDEMFWSAIKQIVNESMIRIDRPQGTVHPQRPDLIYPLDYGYLEGTTSGDGQGIDVWVGSEGSAVEAILCTIDLWKRDMEIKLLIGCSEQDIKTILSFLNSSGTLICKVVSKI